MDVGVGAWTPARARRLDVLSGSDGIVVGVAVDHRDSLRVALERKGVASLSDEQVSELKLTILRALAPAATLVLADAESSAAQAIAAGAVPGTTALATPLEAQGYGSAEAGDPTRLLDDWTPADAARLGAVACKLLLPFRVDREDHARAQLEVAATALAGCRAAGCALVLEPIVFGSPTPGELAELVVAGAARLARLGPDLLKVQYPGSEEACRRLDAACGPDVPWVLLGGGADAEALCDRVETACRAGASGFVVGRSLWQPALGAGEAERERVLREQSLPLLDRLARIARERGTPWRRRVGQVETPPLGWQR